MNNAGVVVCITGWKAKSVVNQEWCAKERKGREPPTEQEGHGIYRELKKESWCEVGRAIRRLHG